MMHVWMDTVQCLFAVQHYNSIMTTNDVMPKLARAKCGPPQFLPRANFSLQPHPICKNTDLSSE